MSSICVRLVAFLWLVVTDKRVIEEILYIEGYLLGYKTVGIDHFWGKIMEKLYLPIY